MATDVFRAFGLNTNPSFVLLSQHDLSDASFALVTLLQHHLLQGSKVCLITLMNSSSHFRHICQKIGLNLTSYQDKGQLNIIEGLSMQFPGTETPDVGIPLEQDNPLKNLLLIISQSKLCEQSVIIIDDVSVFLSLGLEVNKILDFIQRCRHFLKREKCSFIVGVRRIAVPEDDHTPHMQLYWYLAHQCDVHLETELLSTGISKDVHGQIRVSQNSTDMIHPQVDIYLYKLTERCVKLQPTTK